MESPIVTMKVTYSGGGNYLWQWHGNGVSHKSQQMKFLDALQHLNHLMPRGRSKRNDLHAPI